jgi:hypothetical protein
MKNIVSPCHPDDGFTFDYYDQGMFGESWRVVSGFNCDGDNCFNSWDQFGNASEYNKYEGEEK